MRAKNKSTTLTGIMSVKKKLCVCLQLSTSTLAISPLFPIYPSCRRLFAILHLSLDFQSQGFNFFQCLTPTKFMSLTLPVTSRRHLPIHRLLTMNKPRNKSKRQIFRKSIQSISVSNKSLQANNIYEIKTKLTVSHNLFSILKLTPNFYPIRKHHLKSPEKIE